MSLQSDLIDIFNSDVAPTLTDSLGLPPGTIFDDRYVSEPGVSFGTEYNFDNVDTWGVSSVVSYDLSDNIVAKWISGYREVDGIAGRDGDHSPFPIVQTISEDKIEQVSQEIQLSGTSIGGRLNWTLGAYGLWEDLQNRIVTAELISGLFDAIGVDLDARSLSQLDGSSLAVFGQGIFDISDRLSLTFGGRYTWESKDFENEWRFLDSGDVFTCPGLDINDEFEDCDRTWKVFNPMVSLSYDVTDSAMVYASFSEGFKAGGWTPRLFSQAELSEFNPEELAAYELGLKTSWLDNKLTLNGAVFYSDYQDLQLTSVLTRANGAPAPVVENAGEARIIGLEIEGLARFTENTTAQFGVGFLDTKYRRLDPGVSFSIDNVFPDAPRFTASASLVHDIPVSIKDTIRGRIDASYKGDTQKDVGNNPLLVQDSYVILNSRISYISNEGRWEASVFGTNLLDETYLTSGLVLDLFGVVEGYYGRPREWGVELKVKF